LVLWVGTAAALPARLTDKIVDQLMVWGDHYIGGPFKKGSGDEAATRAVLSDLLGKTDPLHAVLDITVKTESHTATAEEDAPGYSQAHGVPTPSGSSVSPQKPAASAPPTVINLHPEIHPVMPAGKSPNNLDNWLDDDDFNGPPPTSPPRVSPALPQSAIAAPASHTGAGPEGHSGTGAASPETANGSGGGASAHANQIELKSGQTTWAQPNPEVSFHPNPEAANAGGAAASAPSVAPAAAAPAAPAAPTRERTGPTRDAPMGGAREIFRGGESREAMERAASTS
jgi:hypothetical protein